MRPLRLFFLASILWGLWAAVAWPQGAVLMYTRQHGLRVPAGFEVSEFADSTLANDIYTMTIDPRGRVVVAGRGYIRILVDDDGDGRADRAIDFADGPKDGAMGLLWEGNTLYVTGDGGLRRYHERNGRADGPSELIRAMKTGDEHSSHALRRGPDGWLYVLCGNQAGINKSYAQLPTSPVQDPVAGCVLRFTPDLKASEIVAHGFRNPYGMDFNRDGELFTFDSDNERCVSLPWYEPTRFYHVIPGGHHGWLAPQQAQWWRYPPYFADVIPPVTTLGRGSPTGVVCYRHVQFPERYRGGMFLLDWTFGKVYFVTLRRAGATYTCDKEVFLESVGENGFAPTAAAVHPQTGDLYLSIGGRGTRGAVYRIRYTNRLPPEESNAVPLQLPPHSLDWQPNLGQELMAQADSIDPLQRLRALHDLRRHQTRFRADEIRVALRANWGVPDRLVRQAAARLIAGLDEEQQKMLVPGTPLEQMTYALARCRTHPEEVLQRVGPLLEDAKTSKEVRLTCVRLIQLALGDLVAPKAMGTVREGYSLRLEGSEKDDQLSTQALKRVRRAFPSGHADLDRELSRTLAMLQAKDTETLGKGANLLAATDDPVEAFHYLIVLGRLRGARSQALTTSVADALVTLDRRLTERQLNRDRHWPLRFAELHAELARRDPSLNAALLAHKEFGRADHALFAHAPGFDQRRAARIFLDRAKADKDYPWSADLVKLVSTLPEDEGLPVLRQLWGQAGLEVALLPVLARQPQAADRDKFVAGLTSPELSTIRLSLEALRRLPRHEDPAATLALIAALGRLPEGQEGKQLRAAITEYLQQSTGQSQLGDRQAWTTWFSTAYPKLAVRLSNPDGVDVDAWQRRSRKLDWAQGDAGRGRAVFVRTSCATCHSGGQALGPDLQGVAGRFSREDLFTAIVQPSRDISPRYRTTMVETTEGKVYQGLVIYEAVDGMLLQTATTTVRVAGDQIAAKRVSPLSLMPAGLLDNLADRDLVDLYAYLRSLTPRAEAGTRPQ